MNPGEFSAEGYDILRSLGSGGTAKVFLAKKNGHIKPVALKTPFEENLEINKFTELIRREINLIGNLKYPGLLRAMKLDTENERKPFLVLEYCPGITLDQLKQTDSPTLIMNLLSSIAINLYYMDLAGLSHGDLKPQNIFLWGQPEGFSDNHLPYTKISDFSLGKKHDENVDDRLGLGTVGYIAPETYEHNILDCRSDIFALGVISYILVTGRHPFINDDNDPVVITARVKEHQPPAPIEFNGTISKKLSELIMQMLEKRPDCRPQNGYHICSLLEKFGSSYPYKQAIRPKYVIELFARGDNKRLLGSKSFALNEIVIERLLDFAGDDRDMLRGILEINFSQNKLVWQEGRLTFNCPVNQIIYPQRIRNYYVRSFHRLPHSIKRQKILSAIAGDVNTARSIGLINEADNADDTIRPYLYYLRSKLSEVTVKRYADKLADSALNKYNNKLIASRLYIKSGNIEKAYNLTLDAANELINENKHSEALTLLASFDKLCLNKNEYDKRRIVLMTIGDTQKTIGEAARAEKTYKQLINLYENLPPDKLLAETYKDLGDLYKIKQNYEEGIKVLREAERLYNLLNDHLELSHTLNNIGNIRLITGKFQEALIAYRKALKIQRRLKNDHDAASTLNNIGSLFFFKGMYKRTLGLFLQALKIQRKIGNAGEIARTLNNMGYLLFEMGDIDKALEALQESNMLNRKIGSKKELLYNLENLTAIMLAGGKLKEAIDYLKDGMALSRELSDNPHTAVFIMNMGIAQKRMGYYGQALENFEKAMNIIEEISDTYQLTLCQTEIAELYIRINDRVKAERLLDEISGKVTEINDNKFTTIVYLLQGKTKGNRSLIEKAISIAIENNATRNKNLARLSLAELLIQQSDFGRAGELLNDLSNVFVEGNSDIENSFYLNLRGVLCRNDDNPESAISFFNKALNEARQCSQLPEQIICHQNLGKLYSEINDPQAAYNHFRKAMEAVKIIAGDIKDEDLRKKYLSDGRVPQLAEAVRKLSAILK